MEITLIGKYALWMLAALIPAQILIGYMVAGKAARVRRTILSAARNYRCF